MKANTEQLQAINSNADRILCLAGAGSGKTATMLGRISRLVSDGVDPTSIMALTFTNAAAAEMRERYERQNSGKATPEFRTFHSFCYTIVCQNSGIRAALGYETIPLIASDEQIKEIEEKAKAQCNITLTKLQLDKREGLTKKEKFQLELYDRAVTRFMKADNLITFDKLNSAVSDLFALNNPATDEYKAKYKYIFVDEFQDTDFYQIQFLNSFKSTAFYFCGDVLQEIYRFRGTSNEYIKALANTPDWEKIRLFTNYRSTNQICEYTNAFSVKYADPAYRIEMKGIRDGNKVITRYLNPPAKYIPVDTEHMDKVVEDMADLNGTTAIICRTNKEVSAVSTYLREHDISFTTNKDTTIQHLIECTLSDTYMMGWLAAHLSSNKYGEYIRLSTQIKNADASWFLRTYGSSSQISDYVKKIKRLKAISESQCSVEDKISLVKEEFDIKEIKPADTEYFGAGFLKYLQTAISEIKSSELYVGTIHSVKGLEYDNVFVLNVGSYSFKLDNEEMKNLFYVAITRAKNRLYVYRLFE